VKLLIVEEVINNSGKRSSDKEGSDFRASLGTDWGLGPQGRVMLAGVRTCERTVKKCSAMGDPFS